MQTNQRSLFDGDLADVMSRDAAMERGLLLEVDATTWVRIDRRGVVELHKTVMPEGVSTREVRISPLPLLPVSIKKLRYQFFLEVLYGTRGGAIRVDHVLLDAVARPELHKRTICELATRGFDLDDDAWQDLAKTLRAVMRTRKAAGDLVPESVSPMQWAEQRNFLVPRRQEMLVIRGGKPLHRQGDARPSNSQALRPV